jgi:Lon protease-like protein
MADGTPEVEVEEIPLFPLGLVLFPGMVQPLFIYEERYKEMVNYCLETTTPFGIAWAYPTVGDRVGYVAAVGTSAAIVNVEKLEEGRMNIVAVGRSRFRILSVHDDHPYLTARVQTLPIKVEAELRAAALGQRVQEYYGEYAPLLQDVAGVELRLEDWPEDAAAIAVLAAILLQVPMSDKQQILNAATVDEMLAQEIRMFRREGVLWRHMAGMMREPHRLDAIQAGPFSLN